MELQVSEWVSNDVLGLILSLCPLRVSVRATATCRSLARDFVWKSLRVLDVRDEWRKDELRVVASLMKNLDVLTGVEKIHCFPTGCVDKWQTICLRLGPQLRYLQFGHPSMAQVKAIVDKLDPSRLEYLFFAHVPPHELKAIVDRKCHNMKCLTVCGIVPNVPDQEMHDLFDSVAAHTGKLHELTLKLGNSPADLPSMFASLKSACAANPQLESVHIVHFMGGYKLLQYLFTPDIVLNPEKWHFLDKNCVFDYKIPLRGLRLTGQTAWQAIMAELELQPTAQRKFADLDYARGLFNDCYAEDDFVARADALGDFLTALRHDSAALPEEYRIWIEEVIQTAHDLALRCPIVPYGVIRGEKALAAWSLRTNNEPKKHMDRFKELLEATKAPLLSLVRSLSPQLLNTQLPVVTELLKDTTWARPEWVNAILTDLPEDEKECITRLLSSPDAARALLHHPAFDFTLKRPETDQLCITWLLINYQFSASPQAMPELQDYLLQLHVRLARQLGLKTLDLGSPLSESLVSLLIDSESGAEAFANVFPDPTPLLQSPVIFEFIIRRSLQRLRQILRWQHNASRPGEDFLPFEVRAVDAIWRCILEHSSTIDLLHTIQDIFLVFNAVAVPEYVIQFAAGFGVYQFPPGSAAPTQFPPQVREVLRVALVSIGVDQGRLQPVSDDEQETLGEPPAKRQKLE
eukprot:TRINITY_DN8629_c0_g1_i1.p1 TRINITY_DN8629_c0_g1~~TRINITY_DN8629_c0_g1_i1.p1  ORF type:complete len:757 (-),score=87.60 TRINITY_DN8629_c0_g1_i1:65-2134(-)